MIDLIINGKEAVLPKEFSFEYIAENRAFTEADDYSLNIELPLAGCPQNIGIFGHINRFDSDTDTIVYTCEIRALNFYRYGSLTITDISENSIKVQFLGDKSAQNFLSTFDDIYINELNLGSPNSIAHNSFPRNYRNGFDSGAEYVVLPWCNNASGIIQNDIVGGREWAYTEAFTPAAQMYLLHLTESICEQLGYRWDFSEWYDSCYRHLIVCNALPLSWKQPDFAKALPRWSVTEFFEQLGLFLYGEFDINHDKKTISFSFYRNIALNYPIVKLDNILNEISVEISKETCSYRDSRVLKYANNGAVTEHFYACDWYISQFKDKAVSLDKMESLMDRAREIYLKLDGQTPPNSLYYVAEYDCYFILSWRSATGISVPSGIGYITQDGNSYHIVPINRFAPSHTDEDAEEDEIKIVPVPIEFTDESHQFCIFLNPGAEEIESSEVKTIPEIQLAEGDKSKTSTYENIYVGFWEPDFFELIEPPYPHPLVDYHYFQNILYYHHYDNTLCLRNNPLRQRVHNIDGKTKYTIKFLSTELPNPRSVFVIEGKKYLCESISTTFTHNGMSDVHKGVFYRIID